MRMMLLTVALAISTPTLVQAADTAPLTASAAGKASYVKLNGGAALPIYQVIPGPNDSVSAISVIFEEHYVTIPGATISPLTRNTLQTSLTRKDVAKLP